MRLLAVWLVVLSLSASAPVLAETGLARSGRWFTYHDQPIYLVGFDTQELACNPSLDYEHALDAFARAGINKARIWVYCWFGTSTFQALTPWRRDASGRHDLDHWNDRYWKRVRAVVASARRRGIMVEVTIFAPYPNRPGYWWGDPNVRNAWNGTHNVQGVFSTNRDGHFYPQFYDLAHAERGRRLQDYQQALVEKTVNELARFDNVYLEVANEFAVAEYGAPSGAIDRLYPWQRHWAELIDRLSPRLVAVHADADGRAGGAEHFASERYIDVLNFRLSDASLETVIERLRPYAREPKVLTINETGVDIYEDLDAATRYAWAMFMAGGHVGFYEDDSRRIGSPEWRAAAARLRVLRTLAEGARFWRLAPVDDSGNSHRRLLFKRLPRGVEYGVLARPGREYVAYFVGDAMPRRLTVSLPAGHYRYRWHDVRDGRPLAHGVLAGGRDVQVARPPGRWPTATGATLIIETDARPDS